ncbi:TlpA family protein disulfide reductase [Rubrobacter taiwanensis]|jgi:thiol-disulfide isomerase/thioredoxin|uniref:TlpA family protein disulfide reductase n=1 Tax=Rubrobacter taiwanensis TaxID=185139 RepID=A0A4V2NW42_9ACTN|nr:TlpA disulfide reductase family protein [Rubrobacter taiwanensis]TCJ15882.1 TlpA family protein disulfide reductase [Rubrobacter taiwanensis]
MADKDWMREKSGGSKSSLPLILAGITGIAIIAIAVFAIVQASGGQGESFTPNSQGLLPAGSQAPDFTADTVNGRGEVSLSETGGANATMLVFFASWCPHCQNEAPVIADLKRDYGEDLRVIMIGIDSVQGDDPAAVRGFVEEYGIDAPAIYEPSLGATYQVSGYPTTYVLDGSNEIVAAHAGEAPEEAFRSWIEEALA